MPDAPLSPQLGDCVRALRRRLDLTLTQVSERTGMAVSTLSKVENGLMSLTYDKIVQLAEGLGVDIVEIFAPASQAPLHGRRSYTPGDKATSIATPNYEYGYVCADLSGKRMVPIVVEVRARSIEEFGPLSRHSGEEYGFVIRGSVRFHSESYEPLLMKAGSSVYFDARMGHAYVKAGAAAATILCMCTAPEAELREISKQEQKAAVGIDSTAR
jgi:transcriptional regulator with XRE-family HTH domain